MGTLPSHIVRKYLRGGCYDFALELHKKTGLELWGLKEPGSGDLHHAFVADPISGVAMDIRGHMPLSRISDGAVAGLVRSPISEREILDVIGSADPATAREARRIIRDHMSNFPYIDRRHDSGEFRDVRRITMERGERAGRILNWSDDRMDSYRREAATRPVKTTESWSFLDPGEFGMSEDEAFSPGDERRMTQQQRIAIGRWDAAKALESWSCKDPEPTSRQDALHLALTYLDKFEVDLMSPEDVHHEIADISGFKYSAYDGDPAAWIRMEHLNAIEDGRPGYVDLMVEKIQQPNVYRLYENGSMDIADGWHRTAAALSMGDTGMSAVIVPLPGLEQDAVPEP